jgi:phosphoadenosine phosphosulfate reductase
MPRPLEASAPAATPELAARAAQLDAAYGEASAQDILRAVIVDGVAGPAALVSSFGADAVVLLHLAASVDRAVPVIFIDTGRHFPETLAYRDEVVARLGLADLRTFGPSHETEDRLDPHGALFNIDADRCCGFRKVEPLAAALTPFSAWISGRKRHQAATRAAIPVFEADGARIKVNPLAGWSAADVKAYRLAHDLPAHPLVAKGYPSIGCMPCTTAVAEGEDERAGRWRGQDKTECGIHFGAAGLVRGAN